MLTPAFFPARRRHNAASGTDGRKQLPDERWILIEEFFDRQLPTCVGGRPPTPPRVVFEAFLWVLAMFLGWTQRACLFTILKRF